MKNIKFLFPVLVLLVLIFCQSCYTVTGVLIGEAKRNKDVKASKTALLDANGWIEPANTWYSVELSLQNEEKVIGRYQGKDYSWDGEKTDELVIVETENGNRLINTKHITNTKIYIYPKKSARNGALIGAGLDILSIVLIAHVGLNGSGGGIWDLNLDWN